MKCTNCDGTGVYSSKCNMSGVHTHSECKECNGTGENKK